MPEFKTSGQFVIPGNKIGVIEEFTPGPGTYVADGSIFAKIVGRILLDLVSKSVSVYPLAHNVSVPQAENLVTGDVVGVQDSIAIVRIFKIGTKSISGVFNGMLHVSDANIGYVESMFDVCRLGDIVRAKVISDMNSTYHLSTKGGELGVIYAFCSRCGSLLKQKKANMVCDACGNVEKRKITSDYEKGVL